MVAHAGHCFLLSAHQEVDQQVEESRRTCCQCHSGEDSVRSECAHHSRSLSQGRHQERQGRNQSHRNQQQQMSGQMEKIQIWSAIPELLHQSGSASGLTSQLVLFRESVSGSPRWISSSLLDIISNTQVRLTEQVLSLIRTFHPHLESLLFSNSEFRVGLRELEFTPSLTIEEVSINSRKSSLMDGDDSWSPTQDHQAHHPRRQWSWSRKAKS